LKTNKTSTKGPRHKKLEIKRIIAEVEIPTTNRKNYNFLVGDTRRTNKKKA
jgi:hypothetical protein